MEYTHFYSSGGNMEDLLVQLNEAAKNGWRVVAAEWDDEFCWALCQREL